VILAVLTPDEEQALNFSVLFAVFLLIALAVLWWNFRPKRRKRKRKHRHGHAGPHPTRAELGGLPPARDAESKPAPPET